jgi:hypothetical protein
VPMEVTVRLLENAMRSALENHPPGNGWAEDQGRFLIDGFPRKLDQAVKFEAEVCVCVCGPCRVDDSDRISLGVHSVLGADVRHDGGSHAPTSS